MEKNKAKKRRESKDPLETIPTELNLLNSLYLFGGTPGETILFFCSTQE